MARLARDLVLKREAFLTKLFEKAKAQDAENPLTLDKANEALKAEFSGKKEGGKMNAKKALEIRRKVYGSKVAAPRGRRPGTGKQASASKPAATTTSTTTPPTQAARRGRPATKTTSNGIGLFVLSGTQEGMAHLLKLADAAEIPVAVDEGATQAVTALRAHG